ncbi:MAG: bifunctional diaminohydroxyphosphoribosylaminopyrimidine deaminase/5-amino-6-(5-phosphoribosylamino)uracil reductase RibD [bacterium]|nr:bifunctional diaminohydroxyphosphoribosylaminopyrimidine deaminase/5-amino-6-(5-phosphoribosylamino)uracil reductase RibD [bacterium]
MTPVLSIGDQQWLAQARDLAERGRYTCPPNPMVGAVLVQAGAVVGEGWHQRAGGPHAEVHALRAAAAHAAGATLYVTLEPCCTHGRTPPCTDAILAAGIPRVVVGSLDPNPAHSGRGIEILRARGLAVEVVHDAACILLNEKFFHYMRTGLPFVHAKWAMTLDGKIATHSGDARWISCAASRDHVHHMRAEYDAILVGIGTVLRDDPRLDVRLDGNWRPPRKIVLDQHGRTPHTAALLQGAPTTIVCGAAAPAAAVSALTQAGAQVLRCPVDEHGLVLRAVLTCLAQQGITSVLVEGGAHVLGSFFDAGLIDRATIFIAPKLCGGAAAPSALAGRGVAAMADALQLRDVQWHTSGDDLMVTGLCSPPSVSPAAPKEPQ